MTSFMEFVRESLSAAAGVTPAALCSMAGNESESRSADRSFKVKLQNGDQFDWELSIRCYVTYFNEILSSGSGFI